MAALLATTLVPTSLQGQFSVRPVLVSFPAGQGGTRVETIRNESDRTLQFRLYVADFEQKRDGGHLFLQAGDHERSCADRLSVFPDGALLEPGETLEARIEMEPGPTTCWSVMFVETVDDDAAGYSIAQRIGVKVYGVGQGSERAGEVRSVTAVPEDGGLRVSFVVANTGDVPVRARGNVEIRDLSGEVRSRRSLRPFSVLPGHERAVTTRVPAGLPPDRYLAVPLVDIGAEYLLGGQTQVDLTGAGPARPADGEGASVRGDGSHARR